MEEIIIDCNDTAFTAGNSSMEAEQKQSTGVITNEAILQHYDSEGQEELSQNSSFLNLGSKESSSISVTNTVVGTATTTDDSSRTISSRKTKRINNFPFENPKWESFESNTFCMFRLLPDDANLMDRSFALGFFMKLSGCRFNCGDIVSILNHKSVVFLGVRFAKTENAGDLILLYFFPFEAEEQDYEDYLNLNCSKDTIIRDLFMIRATDLTNSCPDILSENGLLYTEICIEVVTNIMTQLRWVLLECPEELVLLEHQTQLMGETSSTDPSAPANSSNNHDNSTVDLTNTSGDESTKTGKKAAPAHTRSIRQIVSKAPQLLSSSGSKSSNKSTSNLEPAVKKRDANAQSSTSSKSQTKKKKVVLPITSKSQPILSQKMHMKYTEASLSSKTCEQLKDICNQQRIYYPEKIKKADLLERILSHSNHTENTHRPPQTAIYSTSNNNASVSMKEVAQLINDGTSTMHKSLLNHVGNLIENKLSNIKAVETESSDFKSSSRSRFLSERVDNSEHDELIAAKATLAAQKQHSQDTNGLLKQHIEIFSQIAKASTEPVLDAVKTALLSVNQGNNNGSAAGSTFSSQQLQNRQLLQMLQQQQQYGDSNVLPAYSATQLFPASIGIPSAGNNRNISNSNQMLQQLIQQQHGGAGTATTPLVGGTTTINAEAHHLQSLLGSPSNYNSVNNIDKSTQHQQSLLQSLLQQQQGGFTSSASVLSNIFAAANNQSQAPSFGRSNSNNQMLLTLLQQQQDGGSSRTATSNNSEVQLLKSLFGNPSVNCDSFCDNNTSTQAVMQLLQQQQQQGASGSTTTVASGTGTAAQLQSLLSAQSSSRINSNNNDTQMLLQLLQQNNQVGGYGSAIAGDRVSQLSNDHLAQMLLKGFQNN